MNSLRIPLGLTAISVVGLVVALAEGGVLGALGVAMIATPLVAITRAFVNDRRAKKTA